MFQLLSGKDQPLLIWRDSLLVLDLGFHIVNGIRGFYFQSYGFASQCLDKDLHSSSETQNQVKCRFFLDVVIRQSSPIFKLLSREDQSLLIWRDALLVLDLGFHIVNPM